MTVAEQLKLKKCPFCGFINIHEDTITHHIRYTDDAAHVVADIERLDKSSYIIVNTESKPSQYVPYIATEDLPSPWINCLWCSYRDKIEFDLSLHMLEKHKVKVLQLPVSAKDRKRTKAFSGDFFARFEAAIEFRLDVAVEMAKEDKRGRRLRRGIRVLQKRAIQRRKEKEQRSNYHNDIE